jgi:signal transduction histidine kinase
MDITERKQFEEDLSHAQAVGNIGSWRLDVQKNELTWSEQNYQLFEIPKGTPLTYETFLSTIHPDDRRYVDTQWESALKGEPYDVEHRIVVGDKVKWVREKAFLEFDKDNALLAGFGITQDITERKQAQIELQEANKKLEARVEERTKELTETVEMLNTEVSERKRLEKEVLTISEEEQRRIGRELHDGLQQELVGTTFNCERLRRKLASQSLPEAEEAATIHTLLKNSIEHARDITRMLYPIDVESNELPIALAQLATRVEHLFSIVCKFECNENITVNNADIAINLYRIVQEAITNAIKHGKADTVLICLRANQERLTLSIRDNGVGLKADYAKTKGMGLRIMKYRASVIGASLDINANTEGPGMRVTCSLETKDRQL